MKTDSSQEGGIIGLDQLVADCTASADSQQTDDTWPLVDLADMSSGDLADGKQDEDEDDGAENLLPPKKRFAFYGKK